MSQTKHVLHAITGLGVGGAENMLHQVVPELNTEEQTHSIVSLTDDNEIGKKIEAEGVDVEYLGLRRDLLNLPLVIYRFLALLREKQPDVLYCYLIHTNILGRILGRLAGVDTIICSIRNKHIDKRFLNWLDRMTSGLVDRYVPNSEATVPFVRDHQGIPEEKITVIPNGIDVDEFNIDVDTKAKRDQLGIDKDSFLIGCVAKLQPQKDHETLINAYAAFQQGRQTDLLLIGDGPLRDDLKALAAELGVADTVHFLGWRDDVPELLHTIDVFVLPSRHEGMSNALLEAMASQCCCVVSEIPENTVLITKEKDGLTFPVGEAGGLRRALEESQTRKHLGEDALQTVKKNFSLTTVIEKYRTVISQCVA